MAKGRFREFYQCDFDIAGQYDLMMPDAEVIKIIDEILSELEIGNYVIKVNSRKILDAMVELSGAPKEKFKAICSAIDKLDKEDWAEVKRELVQDKGITEEAADILGQFVKYNGSPLVLLQEIKDKNLFAESAIGMEGLNELELLF